MKNNWWEKINIDLLKQLLNQFWLSVKISHWSILYNWISKKVIEEMYDIINKKNFLDLWVVEIFTLSRIIDYAIKDLWINDFAIVTSYDLEDGYELLQQLNNCNE